jgi:glutamyl-tRNA synthetase
MLLRFAPSPTGSLHLGGLRTALYNHLYARRFGGKWLLRIEDTDSVRAKVLLCDVADLLPKSRTVPGSVDAIRHALDWAGLDYDYGPFNGGPHAPYYQSERLDLYKLHTAKLLERNQAYRCFCSSHQLAFKREALARTGSNKTYDKTCLRLSEEEVVRKVKAGEKFVVRLNVSGLRNSVYLDAKSHCQLGLEATSVRVNK